MDESATTVVIRLETYLKEIVSDAPPIVAVYLFGSYVKGKANVRSDMDLAFLMDEKIYRADPFGATSPAYMAGMLIGMRFNKNTDVVILNSSSVELAYEIVTSGRCIYEKDKDTRVQYEVKMRGLYYDFSPFLTELRSKFLERL